MIHLRRTRLKPKRLAAAAALALMAAGGAGFALGLNWGPDQAELDGLQARVTELERRGLSSSERAPEISTTPSILSILASKARLGSEDEILAVDGVSIHDADQLQKLVRSYPVDSHVLLEARQNGELVQVFIVLDAASRYPAEVRAR